ncbi:MAG: SelB C-terminal domain-containing protein, partial [Actinomycetota bacterium]|nr:SelB C-terminal domain-containing protein [Actinomycetota bacterium]
PAPPRHRDAARLELLASADPAAIVRATVREPVRRSELAARGLLTPDELDAGLAAVEHAGDWHFASGWFRELRAGIHERLAHRVRTSPLDPGVPLGELLPPKPWATAILPLLELDQRGGKAYPPGAAPRLDEHAEAAARLEGALAAAGPAGVRVDDPALAAFLEREGRLVRLGDGLAVATAAYEEVRRVVVEECATTGSVRLARVRDLLGISRRPAQLLLERLDADGVTRRAGDERVLRRSARIST